MYGRELTIDDFARKRGQAFRVEIEGGRLDLVLAHVQELPQSGRQGGSFRLEFHGPPQPVLQQGTYPFLLGSQRSGIFIVPVGSTAEAVRYEAIFF